MIEAVKEMFKNYANFNGRCTRKNFWLAMLAVNLVILPITMINMVLAYLPPILSALDVNNAVIVLISILSLIGSGIVLIVGLATLLPMISMYVRRFHDMNQPGWVVAILYVANMVCCGLGGIVLMIWAMFPGTVGPNQFGEDPYGRVPETAGTYGDTYTTDDTYASDDTYTY